MNYDIIGDTHGHADRLVSVLEQLNYKKINGVFQPPANRKAVFLGDFIDRGPQQRQTLDIARSMVDAGYAEAIMGNHEFNAICYATRGTDGEYLRKHTDKNRLQHADFLAEFDRAINPQEYDEAIEWFKTLPIHIDLGDIRVVHACWHEPSLQAIRPFADTNNVLLQDAYTEYGEKEDGSFFKAIEVLIKSPAYPLPNGMSFTDVQGIKRTETRFEWWSKNVPHQKLYEVKDGLTSEQKLQIDKDPLMAEFDASKLSKPVFIGHFQLDRTPGLLSEGYGNIVCLDFRGYTTAYRLNEGEPFSEGRFVYAK